MHQGTSICSDLKSTRAGNFMQQDRDSLNSSLCEYAGKWWGCYLQKWRQWSWCFSSWFISGVRALTSTSSTADLQIFNCCQCERPFRRSEDDARDSRLRKSPKSRFFSRAHLKYNAFLFTPNWSFFTFTACKSRCFMNEIVNACL